MVGETAGQGDIDIVEEFGNEPS